MSFAMSMTMQYATICEQPRQQLRLRINQPATLPTPGHLAAVIYARTPDVTGALLDLGYDPTWITTIQGNLDGEMLLQPSGLTDQQLDDWLMSIRE